MNVIAYFDDINKINGEQWFMSVYKVDFENKYLFREPEPTSQTNPENNISVLSNWRAAGPTKPKVPL